ncbi:MAG TPA: M56 family metallopeptidase [Planctomycetota bacterium]|nr:M56 family metallopeptidase [Planctomycetota bacterium]
MASAEWIAPWWAWSVSVTLQATLLLGLAWLVDRVLVRRAWPQLIALLWLAGLSRFFVPPDFSSSWSVTASLGAPTLAAAQVPPSAKLLIAVFAIWSAGVVTLLAARCIQRARVGVRIEIVAPSDAWLAALERSSSILGTRRKPRIAVLAGHGTPAAFGLLRPTLLLPADWLARAPTRRDEHALLHELAHLKRGDLWLDECFALVRATLWFHPLVWIALSRLRALGELACDQTVVRALGGEARSYRDTLILAARHLIFEPTPAGVRGFLGHPSAIIVRIERLERAAPRSLAVARSVSALVAVALAACVLPMAPRAADLRAQALAVLTAEKSGLHQSCIALQAAAMVLSADPKSPNPDH